MKYLEDRDLTLYQGDVREVLASLPSESVHCVVTSPPYWGLRDYGTGAWEGGDAECDHRRDPEGGNRRGTFAAAYIRPETGKPTGGSKKDRTEPGGVFHDVCGKCGAHRIDNQLGLEPTPEQYVSNMVEVFREVRRVLRRDGTVFLNIGDSYYTNGTGERSLSGTKPVGASNAGGYTGYRPREAMNGLKPKDLCMIPARLALALQADGWWLRSQIVWSKPNPMPESVTDRPTTSHEFVYLLTRSPRYFFDQEAVRERYEYPFDPRDFTQGNFRRRSYVHDEHHPTRGPDGRTQTHVEGRDGSEQHRSGERWPNPAGRNLRSVWEIPTQPYPEAHFATYPEELVRRCILAGTSERGCCPECGGPWVRETSAEYEHLATRSATAKYPNAERTLPGDRGGVGAQPFTANKHVTTLGWHPSCEALVTSRPDPCTVLDPFSGSGTTALVARKHGRRSIGIELSADYCALTARRLQQLSLLAEA